VRRARPCLHDPRLGRADRAAPAPTPEPGDGVDPARGWGSPVSATTAEVTARVGLIGVGIFLLALLPRLLNLGLFPTSDEDSWMRRTGGFTFGLVNNQLGRTYQNGHP